MGKQETISETKQSEATTADRLDFKRSASRRIHGYFGNSAGKPSFREARF
jgi:hypothetical protein